MVEMATVKPHKGAVAKKGLISTLPPHRQSMTTLRRNQRKIQACSASNNVRSEILWKKNSGCDHHDKEPEGLQSFKSGWRFRFNFNCH